MAEEMLPCPFCGGKAVIHKDNYVEWARPELYPENGRSWPSCPHCTTFWKKNTRAEAIAAWNTRPAPDMSVSMLYGYEAGIEEGKRLASTPAAPANLVEAVLKAMIAALRADCVSFDGECYAAVGDGICQHEGGCPAEVDGEFDLLELAHAAIRALPDTGRAGEEGFKAGLEAAAKLSDEFCCNDLTSMLPPLQQKIAAAIRGLASKESSDG